MLRQKRYSFQRSPLVNSINGFTNLNLEKIVGKKQTGNPDRYMPHVKVLKQITNRIGLRQIEINQNLTQDMHQNNNSSKSARIQINENKFVGDSKDSQQDIFFNKIAQLIKKQEVKMPIFQQNRSAQVLATNRPYTSLSNRNRKSLDNSNISQKPIILHFKNKEDPLAMQEPEKMSTSRALMTYSKIYRNSSVERHKMRRDKHLYSGSVHLQAQKVILQEKQKKQKAYLEKIIEKAHFIQSLKAKRKLQERKNRYDDQQQFQLSGWEQVQ